MHETTVINNRSQVEFVTDAKRLYELLNTIKNSAQIHALDFETTGLYPDKAKVRTLNIFGPTTPKPVVVDLFKCGVDFVSVATAVATTPWFVFNATFEGNWIEYYADETADIYDVGYMSKARLGGRPLSLKQMIARDLGIEISKDEQLSNWSAPNLTDEQITYAGADAFYTYHLGVYWNKEIQEHGCLKGFYSFNDAWRGTLAMETRGMTLDVPYHKTLIKMWELRRATAEKVLRKYTPVSMIENLRSKKQLSDFFSKVLDPASVAAWPKTGARGWLDLDKFMLRQAAYRAPYPFSRWIAALMVFNRADKYLGTYGEKLVNIQERSGSIKARFNIAQAVTGRYSSSEPNLQNIPRNILVRRSFIAGRGRILVLADYSGIELRVLAELANDEQLRRDVIFGDVHGENAVKIFGFNKEKFFAALKAKDPRAKEARAKAKAFSFQLTYGAGNAALAVVLRCSDEEAARYVMGWAERYPNAYNYRFKMAELMNRDGFLPVADRRTIYVRRDDRNIPVASNYPIQGAAADVMYCAISRTQDWFDYDAPVHVRGGLLASIHDELLSVTQDDKNVAELVLSAQKACMVNAWLDVFPGSQTDNLLESAIGYSWAAKP